MTTLPPSIRSVQAYASGQNSPIPSPQKTPRRVLGDLTPNAKLTPKHLQKGAKSPFKTTPLPSPLKGQEALTASTTFPSKEKHDSVSSSGSRKRPYSAIASPERSDATRSPVKRHQDMSLQTVSPAALRSPLPPPIAVIDMPDDEPSVGEEDELDGSSGSDIEHMELPAATQGTSGSFSSLIDYNPDNASDRSDSVATSPASSKSSSEPVTSRVELLKLRLKMAMYKINTNQTMIPFADLAPPHARIADALDADMEDQDEDDASVAPENIIIKSGPLAKLLDGPVLAPTAYSSRFIEAPVMLTSPPHPSIETQQMTPVAARTYSKDEKDLTSSVVKGHAASGLLELAHSK